MTSLPPLGVPQEPNPAPPTSTQRLDQIAGQIDWHARARTEAQQEFTDWQKESDQRLLSSFRIATQTDPNLYAEAKGIATKLGEPPDLIQDNIKVARQVMQERALQALKLRESSPILFDRLDRTDFKYLAHDDVDALSTQESTIGSLTRNWRTGKAQNARGYLGVRKALGIATPEDLDALTAIDVQLRSTQSDHGVIANTTQVLGQMTGTVPLAIGAGAAASLPTLAVAPEAAPLAFTIGSGAALFTQSAMIEGGNAYLDMIGSGYSRDASAKAAFGVGLVNGALELAGAEFVAKPFKAMFGKEVVGHIAGKFLGKEIAGSAFAGMVKEYAKGLAAEVTTETLQEVSQMVGERYARIETNPALPEQSWRDIRSRLGDIAGQTFSAMVVLAGPGPVLHYFSEINHVGEAQQQKQFVDAMVKQAQESKVLQRNPEEYQKHVEALTKDTPAENVYIDAATLSDVLMKRGEGDQTSVDTSSIDQLEKLIPGVTKQIEEASKRGEDIVIPTAEFLSKLTTGEGKSIGDAIRPHIRMQVEMMSQDEASKADVQGLADEANKSVDENLASSEQTRAELDKIRSDLTQQIYDTGRTKPAEARRLAAYWASFVNVQADRLGMSPSEFQKQYPLSVVAGEVAPSESFTKPGEARAAFDPKTFQVALSQVATASDFLHEAAHAMLSIYSDLAQQKAHPTILDDFRSFLQWTGHDEATWHGLSIDEQRKAHENFAANFEHYLFDGKAPTKELQGLFTRFVQFLKRVYVNIRDTLNKTHRAEFGEDLLPLSPEIRSVMDRMLASEDEARVTQAVRGSVPMFLSWEDAKSAGYTPEQWTELQDKQKAADDEAVSNLTVANLRQMRWLSKAKAGVLRELQSQNLAQREALRGDVSAMVQSQPVYRAQRWLKTGELVNEDGTHTQSDKDENHKIRTADAEAIGVALPGMTRADGMSADVVAGIFGYETGEQMMRELSASKPIAETIESTLDARMLAEHENLADPRQREIASEKALHSEARRRFVAAELNALTRSNGSVRVILASIRQAAETAIGSKKVRELNPRNFTKAAQRASMAAQKAQKSGNTVEAIQWKRRQLLQEEMAGIAVKLMGIESSAKKLFAGFSDSDKKLGKTRDIDLVYAGQALAAAYNLGSAIDGEQRRNLVARGLGVVQEEEPVLWQQLQPLLADAQQRGSAIDYRGLTVAQMRNLTSVGNSLWETARDRKQQIIDGRRVENDKMVGEMGAAVSALPNRTAPGAAPIEGEVPGSFRRVVLKGWNAVASLKRVEQWAHFIDGGKRGPFTKYLYEPISKLSVAFRAEQSKVVVAYHGMLSKLRDGAGTKWNALVHSPELDFTFRGKRELIGLLLHSGTLSNLRKLLLGSKGKNGETWGRLVDDGNGGTRLDSSRFDAFMHRMFAEGWLDKADTEFVSATWKLYADYLPVAQATHKALYGSEYETLEHRTVSTPFGDLSGGYVPAAVDYDRASIPRPTHDSMTDLEDAFRYSIGTGKGFTLERNPNFNQPLDLDITRQIGHISDELRFIYLQPGIKNALRLIDNKEFGAQIDAYDRDARRAILRPWLDNTARQATSRRSDIPLVDTISTWLRKATSLAALGFNVINAGIQLTGLSPALGRTKGKYIRSALAQWAKSGGQMAKEIRAKSEFMRQKDDVVTMRMRQDIARMSKPDWLSKITKVQQEAGRAAFFMQRFVQGIADVVSWQGSYTQSIAEGLEEQAAIDAADSAVRISQGSANPEDIAAYEASTPFLKLFAQFGSYSNTMLNQILGAQPGWDRVKTIGWALFLPALMEGWIRTMMQGGPDDKDGDGTIDEWASVFGINAARNVAGLIPAVGPMLMSLAESEGTRVASPISSTLGGVGRGLYELVQAANGEDITDAKARAIATFLTAVTGLPLAAPTRTIQQLTK